MGLRLKEVKLMGPWRCDASSPADFMDCHLSRGYESGRRCTAVKFTLVERKSWWWSDIIFIPSHAILILVYHKGKLSRANYG